MPETPPLTGVLPSFVPAGVVTPLLGGLAGSDGGLGVAPGIVAGVVTPEPSGMVFGAAFAPESPQAS
jgi:hypothetical protein